MNRYWILVVLLCVNLLCLIFIIFWIYRTQLLLDSLVNHLQQITEWIIKTDSELTQLAKSMKEFSDQLVQLIEILKKILIKK